MRPAVALIAGAIATAVPGAADAADRGLEGTWSWGSPRRSSGVPFLRISREGGGWIVETKHFMHERFVGTTREVLVQPGHLEFSYWYEPLARWASCSLDVSGDRMDGECDGELNTREWGRLPAHLWRDGVPASDTVTVRVGADRLDDAALAVLAGKRVGLITNQTGIDSHGRSTIDLLYRDKRWRLAALFAPEHGIRGEAQAGQPIAVGRDERTGLPVFSLYGATMQPTTQMLQAVDVLVYDIQDVGVRYYTYAWTMALALQAAARAGKPFVILDRPNPLGGLVQGNVLESRYASFVGLYPVAMRHGLTAGELALFLNGEFGIGADLRVVRMAGWRRAMLFEETGLKWVPPSPALPSIESARNYAGTCLFEATNLSVGRGTDAAFQQIGAPWLDSEELVRRLAALGLPGVRFQAVRFTPHRPGDGKFDGRTLPGVRFVIEDPRRYDPAAAGVAALVEVRRLHRAQFALDDPDHLDRLAGTPTLREQLLAGVPAPDIVAAWAPGREAFIARAARYRIYE